MLSFHNDINVKRKYVARTEAHRKADTLIRGTGWDGFKGCAVGCTLENYDHSRYPIELGVPEWLARLEDTIFEGMSDDRALLWPSEFLLAIPVGVTEQQFERNVKAPFLILVLERVLTTFDNAAYPDVTAAVRQSIALWQRGDIGSDDFNRAAEAAAEAAWAAAEAAEAAAEAAWAAAEAARAAWAAAWAAAAAAEAAEAEAEAAETYDFYADELLRLLKQSDRPVQP